MKNPITALSDLLNKLVVEHGSAVIQEKHITLLKEQFAILERENTNLQSKNQILETEMQNLKAENKQLKKKIQIYEQENKPFFHSNLLWLPNDNHPYCPTCNDSDGKLIHMQNFDSPHLIHGQIKTKSVLKCPKCNHIADIAEHPKLKTS